MYYQTSGIVLSTIKYGESSVISKIYTSEFGTQSYIINGVRKKRGGSAYYQLLNILNLTVQHKNDRGLQRIKEVKQKQTYSTIPFDVLKSSIAIFLAEILNKCLKEEEENQILYDFIEKALISFDQLPFDSQFHIQFMVKLSRYLGFFPNLEDSSFAYFDLRNGLFSQNNLGHKHYISDTNDLLLAFGGERVNNPKKVLNILIEYYQLHINGFNFIKSKDVLEKVLSV